MTTLDALRHDILAGAFAPGEQLVQETLGERYGVSRVPIREALKMLEAEGQVEHVPHRGYFVARLSVDELHEVYAMRRLLEAELISNAVPRLSDADIAEIHRLAQQVRTARTQDHVASANRAFHFAIFDAAQRPRTTRLVAQLWDSTDPYRAIYFQSAANRERVEAEHDLMVQALAARDAHTAIALHNAHRDHSVETVSTIIRNQGEVHV